MKTPFSFFIALRYLKPKAAFRSVITLISIAGVALAVATLIIVISVMTGFDHRFQQSILGFEPHLTVSADGPLRGWEQVAKTVEQQPGVVAVAPYVKGFVFAQTEDRVVTPLMQGIDPAAEQKIHDLKGYIKKGEFDLNGNNAVIGREMAENLGVGIGGKITIYAPNNVQAIINELHREENDPNSKGKTLKELKEDIVVPQELTVTGIFETGRYEYDSGVVLVPLYVAQELFELGDTVHGLSVRTTNPYIADQTEAAMNDKLPRGIFAEAWMNGPHKSRIAAIKFERNLMFMILMILIVVAAFCVMNTLIIVTVQKRREIGVMKALGANLQQIVWVFLLQGLAVAFIGNTIGLGIGMAFIQFRDQIKATLEYILHIQIFSQDIYEFSRIPAEISSWEVTVICASAFFFCAVAAFIPAWFAARLDPVKALRYE